ncbi:hypothetical protein Tco_0289320 [Tanacetum coccineum]
MLEPTSNKLMVDSIFQLEILSRSSSLNGILPDHSVDPYGFERVLQPNTGKCQSIFVPLLFANWFNAGYLSGGESDEVLKLKNFKKDATLKLSKSTNQEWYEHVGPEVIRSQDDKVTRWRNEIMLG